MVVEPTKLLGIETEKNFSMSATHGKYQGENEAETMALAISGVLTQDPQIGCEQPLPLRNMFTAVSKAQWIDVNCGCRREVILSSWFDGHVWYMGYRQNKDNILVQFFPPAWRYHHLWRVQQQNAMRRNW